MKYNISEKYVDIEYDQTGLDGSLIKAKISTPLMPGNTSLHTFGELDRRQFEQLLPKYVRDLTHGYTEEELRQRMTDQAPVVSTTGTQPPKTKKSSWTQNATVLSVGDNPFKVGSKAHDIFGNVTVDDTIKQNIADGVEFRVLRAAWEKGQLTLSTD
jgi:hypothetical protein